MFKFGFSEENVAEEDNGGSSAQLNWFPAIKINVTDEQIADDLNDEDNVTHSIIDEVNLTLIRSEVVVSKLENEKHENVIKAESQHSDLLPAVYEGGLKVWECSYDLVKYLIKENITLANTKVLDLGCGAGVVGIVALLKGSNVHFQDYNTEVIQLVTIPNVLLNLTERSSIKNKAEFYAGDWAAFNELSADKYSVDNEKYDIILSSETIYNPDNHKKLLEIFKQLLKAKGVGYIAGKTYYFGVGGGMRQFEKLVNDDRTFVVENVWKSDDGLQREIIKLTRQPNRAC